MPMRLPVAVLLAMIATALWSLAGCNQGSPDVSVAPQGEEAPGATAGETEYNPHDAPITAEQKTQLQEETARFGDAVAKIKELCNAIEAETKDGIPQQPYAAHQALDKADLVLKWLPQVARDSGVAKEHWEEINTAANDLRTLLEKVHHNIDNKQDPNFASVAQALDQKISRLEEIAQNHGATGAKG
jgi:hypothetical protein